MNDIEYGYDRPTQHEELRMLFESPPIRPDQQRTQSMDSSSVG